MGRTLPERLTAVVPIPVASLPTVMGVLAGAFVVAVLAIALAAAMGRRVAGLPAVTLGSVPLVGWVVVPAWAGSPWHQLAVALTAAVVTLELTRLWRRKRLALPALCGLLAIVFLCALALSTFGFAEVVFLFAAVECNDSFAFLGGRLVGRRALAPRLSPAKTVEGAAIGLCAATLCGAALAALVGVSWQAGAFLATGLGLAGTCADLLCSAVKRRIREKDFANWLPLHGSVTDVYDAYFLVAPLWWLCLWCL